MFNFNKHSHYFLNKELSELYVFVAIRTFALSLISIFVPIYLLGLGYSLIDILLFYITFHILHGLFSFFAAKFSMKIGFKHSIVFSMPFLIFFYVLLYTLPTYNWPLIILAMVGALNNAIYWIAFHVDFTKSSAKRARGKEVSMLRMITFALNVVGPLIGALIISYISFFYLFFFVSSILIISLIPLFYSKDIHISQKVSLKGVFMVNSWKNFLAFLGNGAETGASLVIWPVFIFFIAGTFISLGLITSIATFFSMITVFLVGRMCDRFKRSSILKFGSIADSLTWFVKSVVATVPQIIMINSLSGIIGIFKDVSFTAMIYDKASKRNVVEFIVFREIVISLGRILFFALMILMVVLYRGLILAGFASLFYLLF
jgi:hypothetical protein